MTIKIFYCLNCNAEVKKNHSSTNTFCSVVCFHAYRNQQNHLRVQKGEITSNSIGPVKRYLIQTRGEKCEECNIPPVWNGKPFTLQLDHIDGDSENMTLTNLRLLCPICHTQTPTYGNKGRRVRTSSKRKDYYTTNREKEYYK